MNRPTDPICAALGGSVFFDWRYFYTQDYDDVKWEKYINDNETIDFIIGVKKLEETDPNMKSKGVFFLVVT